MASVSSLNRNISAATTIFSTMSYQDFDQSKIGWRLWAEKGQFIEAAELIRDYLVEHRELDLYQQDSLWFHAGQMYAFAKNDLEAIACMSRSMQAEQPPHAPVQWKPYVWATIAFLRKDEERLRQQREIIAKGTAIDGEIPNLALVNRMILRLNETYEAVYTAKI